MADIVLLIPHIKGVLTSIPRHPCVILADAERNKPQWSNEIFNVLLLYDLVRIALSWVIDRYFTPTSQ